VRIVRELIATVPEPKLPKHDPRPPEEVAQMAE